MKVPFGAAHVVLLTLRTGACLEYNLLLLEFCGGFPWTLRGETERGNNP